MKCLNCDTEVVEGYEYCHNCGQSKKKTSLSITAIIRDILTNVFNVDSKFFQTVRYIYNPSQLAKAYIQGQRKKYVHPVKLFLSLTIAYITVILWMGDFDLSIGNQTTLVKDVAYKEVYYEVEKLKKDSTYSDVVVLDTLRDRLSISNSIDDSVYVFEHINIFDINNMPPIAKKDLIEKPVSDLLSEYNITDFWKKMALKQYVQINRDPGNGWKYLIKNFVWSLFLTLLFMGAILKLLYIRSHYFYVEHLVFSAYFLSFVSFLLLINMMVKLIRPSDMDVLPFVLLFIGSLAVEVIGIKRFYKQSWPKTILKTFIFNLFSLFIFVLVSVFSSIMFLLIY